MKQLNNILSVLGNIAIANDIAIAGITSDSRQVKPGYVFVAVKGTTVDGHQFIEKAIASGASVIIAENRAGVVTELPFIIVKNAAEALGKLAHAFYNFPSTQIKLIGITGTNGKTTTATLAYHLLRDLGFRMRLCIYGSEFTCSASAPYCRITIYRRGIYEYYPRPFRLS